MYHYCFSILYRDNIEANKLHNFNQTSEKEFDNHGVGYDYLSIMHYEKEVSDLI